MSNWKEIKRLEEERHEAACRQIIAECRDRPRNDTYPEDTSLRDIARTRAEARRRNIALIEPGMSSKQRRAAKRHNDRAMKQIKNSR